MQQHALYFALFQRAADQTAFAVGAHQYRDIGRAQRLAFQTLLLQGAEIQHTSDFIGAPIGGALPQHVFIVSFVACLIEPTHPYRRLRRLQAAIRAVGRYFGVVNVGQAEGAVFLLEQQADAVHQRGMAAEVAV